MPNLDNFVMKGVIFVTNLLYLMFPLLIPTGIGPILQ